MFADYRKKAVADFLQVGGIESYIHQYAGSFFHLFKMNIKFFVGDTECHLSEELNEPAVSIIAEALVVCLFDESS